MYDYHGGNLENIEVCEVCVCVSFVEAFLLYEYTISIRPNISQNICYARSNEATKV